MMAIDDKNFTHYSDPHPQLEGVVYYDKHVQPSMEMCLGSLLLENHRQITAETLYSVVPGRH